MSIQCEAISHGGNAEYAWHYTGASDNINPFSNAGQFYSGRDIIGTAYGGNNSFCDFPASAYRTEAFDGIWRFSITYNGIPHVAYCLEKGVTGADGNPYASIPVEESAVHLTASQKARIAYILANTYPVIDLSEQFSRAGIPPASPPLDENDAYAATQVAIWAVINPPADLWAGLTFYNCADGAKHPKSDRLQAAALHLLNLSAETPMPEMPSVPACCKSASVGGATLINCGGKRVRMECGKWLYGPLMIRASMPFSLLLSSICAPECMEGFITLADACGSPIANPSPGQEFYIAFPSSMDTACYQIALSIPRTVVDAVVMENTDAPPHLQTLIFTPRERTQQKCASMCFCIAPPTTPDTGRKGELPLCFINHNHAVANVRAEETESDVNIQGQQQTQRQNQGQSIFPPPGVINRPEMPPGGQCPPTNVICCPCPSDCKRPPRGTCPIFKHPPGPRKKR